MRLIGVPLGGGTCLTQTLTQTRKGTDGDNGEERDKKDTILSGKGWKWPEREPSQNQWIFTRMRSLVRSMGPWRLCLIGPVDIGEADTSSLHI